MRKGVDFTGVNVVFFCHDGAGNIVLGKRSNTTRDERGRWDLGGGAIEFGEKVEDALKREIKEEYSTDVLDFEFLGFMDVHRIDHDKNKTHWVAMCFKVLVDKKKVKNAAPDDHDEVSWFTLTTLPNPVHSQLPDFLKRFKDKLTI